MDGCQLEPTWIKNHDVSYIFNIRRPHKLTNGRLLAFPIYGVDVVLGPGLYQQIHRGCFRLINTAYKFSLLAEHHSGGRSSHCIQVHAGFNYCIVDQKTRRQQTKEVNRLPSEVHVLEFSFEKNST